MRVKKDRINDLAITSLIVLFGALISLLTHTGLFFSSLYMLFMPSLYLLIRKPINLWRIGTFLFIGIFLGISFDLLGSFNEAWITVNTTLIIPYKLFGVVTIDGIFWFTSWILFMVTFYEHFLHHEKSLIKFSSHFRISLILALLIYFVTTITFISNPSLLKIPFTYAFLIAIISPFSVYFILSHPKLQMKLLKANLFFFFVSVIFEFVGLTNNQWIFPGQYIATTKLFTFVIPLEELVFWIGLSSTIILSYYEFFVNDKR